jgi:hypothetical protein
MPCALGVQKSGRQGCGIAAKQLAMQVANLRVNTSNLDSNQHVCIVVIQKAPTVSIHTRVITAIASLLYIGNTHTLPRAAQPRHHWSALHDRLPIQILPDPQHAPNRHTAKPCVVCASDISGATVPHGAQAAEAFTHSSMCKLSPTQSATASPTYIVLSGKGSPVPCCAGGTHLTLYLPPWAFR